MKTNSPTTPSTTSMTLGEARIKFDNFRNWDGQEYGHGFHEEIWKFFESTLSQLTEQMIPEEMCYDMSIFDKPTSAAKVVVDLNKQFLKEMRRRREELLK